MRVRGLLPSILLVAVACCSRAGCAADVGDLVAEQLSSEDALRMAFEDRITIFLGGWLGSAAEEPFDQRLALACVFAYRGMSSDTMKSLMESKLRLAGGVMVLLADDEKYLKALIKNGAQEIANDERRGASHDRELRFNEQLTETQARDVAHMLSILNVPKEFTESRRKMEGRLRAILRAEPDLLRPFLQAKPTTEQLRKSRQRVNALIREASEHHAR